MLYICNCVCVWMCVRDRNNQGRQIRVKVDLKWLDDDNPRWNCLVEHHHYITHTHTHTYTMERMNNNQNNVTISPSRPKKKSEPRLPVLCGNITIWALVHFLFFILNEKKSFYCTLHAHIYSDTYNVNVRLSPRLDQIGLLFCKCDSSLHIKRKKMGN